jgi:hypothetical protein
VLHDAYEEKLRSEGGREEDGERGGTGGRAARMLDARFVLTFAEAQVNEGGVHGGGREGGREGEK